MYISEYLKIETTKEHIAVESLIPFLSGEFTVRSYADLLDRLLGFFEGYEDALRDCEHVEDAPDFHMRLFRTKALRADLAALGRDTSSSRGKYPFFLRQKSEALGAMYVVEGSTLGGRVIAKRLTDLDIPSSALCFYSSYGAETGAMWMRFKTYLDDHSDQSTQFFNEAVSKAKLTFQAIGKHLVSLETPRFLHL